MDIIFSDGLGHHQQDWLCCEHLPKDEGLGRCLGECSLPRLQLLSKVRTSNMVVWAGMCLPAMEDPTKVDLNGEVSSLVHITRRLEIGASSSA